MEKLGIRAVKPYASGACKQCGRVCNCIADERRPVKMVPEGKYTYRIVYADEPIEGRQAGTRSI